MAIQFHQLKIKTVRYETDKAVQIGFQIPEEKRKVFNFIPGQYLTISLTINNKKVRRAYSICSAVHEPIISILVKRVDLGLVSNHLNDHVKVGDVFEVLPPNGHFKLAIAEKEKRNFYFFGAGSGITPLYSMIGSLLENEPNSYCHLLYGNRDEDNIIFQKNLERLQLVYKNRIRVKIILSRPKKMKGVTGRINKSEIEQFLKEENSENAEIDGYFICGPSPMIESTYNSIIELGIDEKRIHKEYFSAPISTDSATVAQNPDIKQISAKVKVVLDGKEIELNIDDDTNIVQALLDKNIEPPYSCLSGTCSTCMAKIEKGKVAMDVSIGLEEDEKEKGYILTCQSHPLTEDVVINFDY